MSATLPPVVTTELEPFFAAANEGRLVVQRCASCGALRFPPRNVCPGCLSTQRDWEEVSGRGGVYSFVWIHQVYHPAFVREVPYPVVVVRLDEGPSLTTNLLDCAKEELRIDMRVEVAFEDRGPGIRLPQFRPARA